MERARQLHIRLALAECGRCIGSLHLPAAAASAPTAAAVPRTRHVTQKRWSSSRRMTRQRTRWTAVESEKTSIRGSKIQVCVFRFTELLFTFALRTSAIVLSLPPAHDAGTVSLLLFVLLTQWDSNLRPSGRKAPNLPLSHHA